MTFRSLNRWLIVLALLVSGVWLIARPGQLTPETTQRQQAVAGLGPAGAPAREVVVAGDDTGSGMVTGVSAAPAVVTFVNGPAPVPGKYAEAYRRGEFDLEDRAENIYTEGEIERLIQQSLTRGVDRDVQIAADLDAGLLVDFPVNFLAMRYSNTLGLTPPDAEIAVGINHVVEVVNSTVAIYNKADGSTAAGPVDMEALYSGVCGAGQFYFDPVAVYDDQANRYVVSFIVDEGSANHFCIAVSQTSDPLGNWNVYNFDCNPGAGTNYFCDYHRVAAGQDALYVTANMFGQSFVRNHVFAFEKSQMYAGQPANFVKFDVSSTYFTLNPTKMLGHDFGGWPSDAAEPHYIVTTPTLGGRVDIFAFADPWGTPSLTLDGSVTAGSFSYPVSSPQLGGQSITSNDGRLLDAKYWGGHIWATQHVGCNPGSGTVNCIRWYEIDMTGANPSMVQSGTYSSSGEYRTFPDLAVNACGQMVVGYTKFSSSTYPSVYIAGRAERSRPGRLVAERLVHAGEAPHSCYDGIPRRWGDYLDMTVDPVDGQTFWYVGQYSYTQSSCSWATRIASIQLRSCTP